jgi:hypothetical protein
MGVAGSLLERQTVLSMTCEFQDGRMQACYIGSPRLK